MVTLIGLNHICAIPIINYYFFVVFAQDWDRVIHKNVRAADGEPEGTIAAVRDNEGVHIESAGAQFMQ